MYNKPHKNHLFLISTIGFILLIAAFLVWWYSKPTYDTYDTYDNYDNYEPMKIHLNRLAQEEYDSVFLSMHSIQDYSEEDFQQFRGTQTVIISDAIADAKIFPNYFDTIFTSGNIISHIFLSLDPYIIQQTQDLWESDFSERLYQNLFVYAAEHPDILFEILLPYPSLNYWLDKEDTEINAILTSYQSFIIEASRYSNVNTYFFGHEYWLIGNPANYSNAPFDVNPVIAQKILMFAFCDHEYQINTDNVVEIINSLTQLITNEKTAPSYYPDLSELTLVFFGDSVIDYVRGSYSIPGYINGLSGATVYSCAHGGTQASARTTDSLDFPNIIDDFFAEYCAVEDGHYLFQPEGEAVTENNLCFIVNYGLNDYFTGAPLDNPSEVYDKSTYAGGLRNSISILQKAFPSATFVILTPIPTGVLSNGTDINSENGGQLTDYVEKAIQTARELNAYCLNCYDGLGIDKTNLDYYLVADGVHPNETGRLTMATYLMYYLEDIFQRN